MAHAGRKPKTQRAPIKPLDPMTSLCQFDGVRFAGSAAKSFSMSFGLAGLPTCRTTAGRHGFMDPNLMQREVLIDFWAQFGGKKRDGGGADKATKIAALRKLSRLVIPYKRQMTVTVRRDRFNKAKSVLHKLWIGRNRNCFCCGNSTEARHHIIQLQNGGLNSRKNLVSLCDLCHAEIHPWLSRPSFPIPIPSA